MIRRGMPSGESASSRGMIRGCDRLGDLITREFSKWHETGNTADLPVNLKLLNIIWDVPNSPF
jgi:hypothetical protein